MKEYRFVTREGIPVHADREKAPNNNDSCVFIIIDFMGECGYYRFR